MRVCDAPRVQASAYVRNCKKATTSIRYGKASGGSLHRPHTRSKLIITSAQATEATTNESLVPNLIEFLKEDLQHLFDDQGIDSSKYEDNVVFEDPITRHNNIQGYLLNIAFLRHVFDPTFSLLDIRQTGPYEITTRWSMVMKPTFVRLPALQKFWNPVLTFTGTSVMGVNPATGKFNSHSDTWDAVSNQKFFSLEAFVHMLKQVLVDGLLRTPQGLESPPYEVLVKKAGYEIRKYESFVVAEAPYGASGSAAFGALAGYIFGKNIQGQKIAMTTPVLSTTSKMQFYLGSKAQVDKCPPPLSPEVQLVESEGGLFAAVTFNGTADEAAAAAKAAELRQAVTNDGVSLLPGSDWVLARYNDPGTPAPFRKNEVLVQLDETQFKLW